MDGGRPGELLMVRAGVHDSLSSRRWNGRDWAAGYGAAPRGSGHPAGQASAPARIDAGPRPTGRMLAAAPRPMATWSARRPGHRSSWRPAASGLVEVCGSWRRRFPRGGAGPDRVHQRGHHARGAGRRTGGHHRRHRGPPGPRSASRYSAPRKWWSSRPPSTGSRGWTPCRWPSCRTNRWSTTTRATGIAVWVDQFATERGVVLPQPVLRTGSPRTAAQLAAAGMGVALVPFSALTPRTGATVRSIGSG